MSPIIREPISAMGLTRHEFGRIRTLHVDLAIEVRVVEYLHRDLVLALVQFLELGVVDRDILFDVLSGQLNFLVHAPAVQAVERPVPNSGGTTSQKEHEQVGLDAPILDERNERLDDIRNDDQEDGEVDVVEGAVAFSEGGDGAVFNGGEVGRLHRARRHDGERETTIPELSVHFLLTDTAHLELFVRRGSAVSKGMIAPINMGMALSGSQDAFCIIRPLSISDYRV